MHLEREKNIPEHMVGEGYIRSTPSAQLTWERIRKGLPGDLPNYLTECCFLVLKPDMLASGKQDLFWDSMLSVGLQPLISWACLGSSSQHFEELYKFNLTLNNDQCMLSTWWLNSLPYSMGPVVCLLVRVPHELRPGMTASQFIGLKKGPSNPFQAKKGQWRYDLVSTNMSLNLIHASDDPISSARELLIFGTEEKLRQALYRVQEFSQRGNAQEVLGNVEDEFRLAIDICGYSHHDLDLVSNMSRLKLRLNYSIDSGFWFTDSIIDKYRRLINSGGSAEDRWQKYRKICHEEEDLYVNKESPDILRKFAHTSSYSYELLGDLEGEIHKRRIPYSRWEKVVLETTLFFDEHLPG